MAIELDTSRIAAQTTATSMQGDSHSVRLDKSEPLLGGKSLTVTSAAMTDLEKLVAQLKNENQNARESVAHRRLSILQTVLDSMSDRITALERSNLIEIEKLGREKVKIDGEIADLRADKTGVEGRITALDAQIEMLEKAIKQAVEDGKEHNEQVEKLKAQRAEEQKELDRINVAIESANAKLSGIDVKIAECTKAIATATLNEVSNALRLAAANRDQSPDGAPDESNADRVAAEKKAEKTDIANVIRESLDKIDSQIRRALDEAQMKVVG